MTLTTLPRRLALTFLIAGTLAAALPARAEADSRRPIEQVVETFKRAIIEKDTARFMALFLREDIPWVGIHTDASMELIRERLKGRNVPLPKKLYSGSPRAFIEDIASDSAPSQETIDNVRIDADGDVANVWFDYAYVRENYRHNWGKEAWQMVRTEGGWKIVSVIWSIEVNPQPKPARP